MLEVISQHLREQPARPIITAMSHLFISYSRRDQDLAQRIVDALGKQELETWIDWKSIPKGEDWELEIYRGIEAADAFLFLISADSIKSVMCNKEILHAIKNNKRILPILLYDVGTDDFLDEAARAEIKRLNWVFCRKDKDDFDRSIAIIVQTIRADYAWLRFHTMLQTRALAWDRAAKDGSRLLRGKELQQVEKQIAKAEPKTEPALTDLQRQFVRRSRRSVRQRRALPYGVASILATAAFLGGKLYYLILPIADACPAVGAVSVSFDGSTLPEDMYRSLSFAIENAPSKTSLRTCDAAMEAELQVTAGYDPETKRVALHVRLPETRAYRLDFLQEIREFGPELVTGPEAIVLLQAFTAYSVGEYQTAITLLEGQESLSALTLVAQARLFTDDLAGSQSTYDLALQKPQPDEVYRGKLNMGAALALWRPESYYLLSFGGNRDDCRAAARYYAAAQHWIESDKLARNIRIVYARFCVDETDPDYAEYVEWKTESPQAERDLNVPDADETNAIEQYLLAVRTELRDEAARASFEERLISAQSLMLARAALSEFYWGVEENCRDARTWRDKFRSGILSEIETWKLQRLLQSQPLNCR